MRSELRTSPDKNSSLMPGAGPAIHGRSLTRAKWHWHFTFCGSPVACVAGFGLVVVFDFFLVFAQLRDQFVDHTVDGCVHV